MNPEQEKLLNEFESFELDLEPSPLLDSPIILCDPLSIKPLEEFKVQTVMYKLGALHIFLSCHFLDWTC